MNTDNSGTPQRRRDGWSPLGEGIGKATPQKGVYEAGKELQIMLSDDPTALCR